MREDLKVIAADGTVLNRSYNLAGIRRFVSNHNIHVLCVTKTENGEGNLDISFRGPELSNWDGATFHCEFCDFTVLKGFVRRWRNVYGAPLRVNDVDAGKVTFDNPALN